MHSSSMNTLTMGSVTVGSLSGSGYVFAFLYGGPSDASPIGWLPVSDSMAPVSSSGSSALVVEAIPPDGWKPGAVAWFRSKPVDSLKAISKRDKISMVLDTMIR